MKQYSLYTGLIYPKLVYHAEQAGLKTMSFADVLQARLVELASGKPARESEWLNRHIATSDGWGFQNGKIKFLPGYFRIIEPTMKSIEGLSFPAPALYCSLPGKEYDLGLGKKLPNLQDIGESRWPELNGIQIGKKLTNRFLQDMAGSDTKLIEASVSASQRESEKLI